MQDYYCISEKELGQGAKIPILKLGDSGEVYYELAMEMLRCIIRNNADGRHQPDLSAGWRCNAARLDWSGALGFRLCHGLRERLLLQAEPGLLRAGAANLCAFP